MKVELFEKFNKKNKNYLKTKWSDFENTVTIHDIEDYLNSIETPTKYISVNSIKNLCIHLGKTDKKTIKRSEESDLRYPIIIIKNKDGEYETILDGHHRLLKAINNGIKKIKSKILYIDDKSMPKKFKDMFKRK